MNKSLQSSGRHSSKIIIWLRNHENRIYCFIIIIFMNCIHCYILILSCPIHQFYIMLLCWCNRCCCIGWGWCWCGFWGGIWFFTTGDRTENRQAQDIIFCFVYIIFCFELYFDINFIFYSLLLIILTQFRQFVKFLFLIAF